MAAKLNFTDEELVASANRYITKKQWRFSDPQKCLAAYYRGKTFYRQCTSHMRITVNPDKLPYSIYVFEFMPCKKAYVGYTYDVAERYSAHTSKGRGPCRVYRHTLYCPDFIFKVLECDIPTLDKACDAEVKWYDKYKADGWIMINVAKCGVPSGAPRRVFTREEVLAESKQYSSFKEWGKSDRSRLAWMFKQGQDFVDQCIAHMDSFYVYVSDKVIIADARRHPSKMAWCKANQQFYHYASCRKKLWKECIKHMPKKALSEACAKIRGMTDDELLAAALKYKTRLQWLKADRFTSWEALRRGRDFYEKCCAHMPNRMAKITHEEIIASAKKCPSKIVWAETYPKEWRTARDDKKLWAECVSHMPLAAPKRRPLTPPAPSQALAT